MSTHETDDEVLLELSGHEHGEYDSLSDLARQRTKRERMVLAHKRTELYLMACEGRKFHSGLFPGPETMPAPVTPNFKTYAGVSKRTWENVAHEWRTHLRMWAAWWTTVNEE